MAICRPFQHASLSEFGRGDEDYAQEGAGLPGDGSRGDEGGGEGTGGLCQD